MNSKRTRRVSSGDEEANSNVVKVRQRLSGNGEPITFQWYTTRNGNLAPLYKNSRYYKYKKHHQPVVFAEHALYMCNQKGCKSRIKVLNGESKDFGELQSLFLVYISATVEKFSWSFGGSTNDFLYDHKNPSQSQEKIKGWDFMRKINKYLFCFFKFALTNIFIREKRQCNAPHKFCDKTTSNQEKICTQWDTTTIWD